MPNLTEILGREGIHVDALSAAQEREYEQSVLGWHISCLVWSVIVFRRCHNKVCAFQANVAHLDGLATEVKGLVLPSGLLALGGSSIVYYCSIWLRLRVMRSSRRDVINARGE